MSSGFLFGGSVDYYELQNLSHLLIVERLLATWSYFLIPMQSGESARAVVAAANKEVVAVLSGTTTIYYNTCFKSTNHEIIALLTLLLYCISN